ncbi:MAG: hypothetical protein GX061_06450 [Eubacteriaceae bacterium]|nr:hypothetical protein [Eubacteriaceae bacterium]
MYQYISAVSISEAIEKSLKALNENGVICARENQDRADTTKETQVVIDVIDPTAEPMVSKAMPCDINALVQYEDEFLNGTADGDGWKYTYHSLYSPFYDKVIAELKRNINTRRACIALGQGDINFTSDPPCLQLLMFTANENALEVTCLFRSNDAVKAFPMNIIAIAALQEKAAGDMGMKIGAMHYIANNFHAYSKDFATLENYIRLFDKYDTPETLHRKSYTNSQHEQARKKYYESKNN